MSLWMKFFGVTIQMKTTGAVLLVVLRITKYKIVSTIKSMDEIPVVLPFK